MQNKKTNINKDSPIFDTSSIRYFCKNDEDVKKNMDLDKISVPKSFFNENIPTNENFTQKNIQCYQQYMRDSNFIQRDPYNNKYIF